jgi:hypothetical protein
MSTRTLLLYAVLAFVGYTLLKRSTSQSVPAPHSANPSTGSQTEAGGDVFSSILASFTAVANSVKTIAETTRNNT